MEATRVSGTSSSAQAPAWSLGPEEVQHCDGVECFERFTQVKRRMVRPRSRRSSPSIRVQRNSCLIYSQQELTHQGKRKMRCSSRLPGHSNQRQVRHHRSDVRSLNAGRTCVSTRVAPYGRCVMQPRWLQGVRGRRRGPAFLRE